MDEPIDAVNKSMPNSAEDNLRELALKMLERLQEIRYKHPDVMDSLQSLQKMMAQSMQKLQEALSMLPERDRDILLLLIINEIHKTVDEVFEPEE